MTPWAIHVIALGNGVTDAAAAAAAALRPHFFVGFSSPLAPRFPRFLGSPFCRVGVRPLDRLSPCYAFGARRFTRAGTERRGASPGGPSRNELT